MPRRKFIGASGTLTHEQRQIDINFVPHQHLLPHRRLVHICFGLAQGFLFTETQAHLVYPWVTAPGQGYVSVIDRGLTGAPAVATPLQPTHVVINGIQFAVLGFHMNWFRRLQVSRLAAPAYAQQPQFTYIPHKRREPGEDMVPDPTRPQVQCRRLHYGGQVQNWRQIE